MIRRLGRNVVALGVVSLLTDLSTEMIYPLLPIFLTTTLGAPAAMLGLIEGIAESTAGILKFFSGWWSDRRAQRKPLIVLGYSIASIARPLVAFATFANLGIGLPYLVATAFGFGAGDVRAVTYEYGNAFIIVAGLLNLLTIIDAYDVAMGRK